MPTGLLVFCLDYASGASETLPGIFSTIRKHFRDLSGSPLRDLVQRVYEFRNTYIAHQKAELTDPATTKDALRIWIEAMGAANTACRFS
jgi:type III restriction enzyme